MVEENALNIYTDGSCYHSPRRGGIGIRFVHIADDGHESFQDVQFSGYKSATISQMELYACIMALKEAMRLHLIEGFQKVIVFSDSQYVVDNINNAKYSWRKNKWHKRGGSPVLNADLWKELIRCIKKVGKRVEFRKVKAHSQDRHNRAVDKLAKKSAGYPYNEPLSVVQVRRKSTEESVDIGSVEMLGQRISIRIITVEYPRVQKTWKYKYEVISRTNKFKGLVDIIFSDHMLSAGHCYYVVLNDNSEDPRIRHIIRELER